MSGLVGKHIVVTRAPHQAGELESLLRQHGAIPLLYPCIDIAPPTDSAPLKSTLDAASDGAFDWLVLTSTNTVLALKRTLTELDMQPPYFPGLQTAAVGRATADAVQFHLGISVDIVPDEFSADSLSETLLVAPGTRILLPQSALADSTLVDSLTAKGAIVTTVTAYQTVLGSGGVDLSALLDAGEVDAITFTSASTVDNLFIRLTAEGGRIDALHSVVLACIGSKTAAALREHGFTPAVVPDEHTLEGLVWGLERQFEN